MNSLISALLILQVFSFNVMNRITVGDDFAAAVEYQSLLSAEVANEPDTVTVIPTRSTAIVMAHYGDGYAGTAFHAFRRGDPVSLFDAQGIEHRYTLTRSWTREGSPLIAISKQYAIIFMTCTDESGTGTLYWAGRRVS